jgi:hypothetical protein
MSSFERKIQSVDRARLTAARLGSWVALFTSVVTVVSFAIAIFTPPRSGPFCIGACVVYPYSDTAAFFPRDYLWIFPAILLTPLFVVVCACADAWVMPERRIFSRIAVAFAIVSAAIITLDYFIQIEVMQPMLLKGETDGLALFSQYNPHGIFIAMEDLGYLILSAAFFFLGAALAQGSRLESVLRWILMISGILAFVTFIGISLYFGSNLETRFELAIITISWTALAIASAILAILFSRPVRNGAN